MISYPAAIHPQIIRMHFFITQPVDITAIRASLALCDHDLTVDLI